MAPEGKPPQAFHDLCKGLHQDALFLADGSIDQLASSCVRSVPVGKRAELRLYLEALLARLTPAELNGVCNRAKTDIGFRRKGGEAFLRAVVTALEI